MISKTRITRINGQSFFFRRIEDISSIFVRHKWFDIESSISNKIQFSTWWNKTQSSLGRWISFELILAKKIASFQNMKIAWKLGHNWTQLFSLLYLSCVAFFAYSHISRNTMHFVWHVKLTFFMEITKNPPEIDAKGIFENDVQRINFFLPLLSKMWWKSKKIERYIQYIMHV